MVRVPLLGAAAPKPTGSRKTGAKAGALGLCQGAVSGFVERRLSVFVRKSKQRVRGLAQ